MACASDEAPRWRPGATVVLQEVWRSQLWSARPMRVVEDGPQLIALWKPAGTRWRTAVDEPGVEPLPRRAERFSRRMSTMRWDMGEFTWEVDTLWLIQPGRHHAVCPGWRDGVFLGWYVNLQEPVRRAARSLQTMDLMLDLVIDPSGEWRWKDEDEVEVLIGDGVIERSLVERLRIDALGVVDDRVAGRPPFDRDWDTWRPSPTWKVPDLPTEWPTIAL